MGWDTDKTDVDLHVHEPDNSHVYFGSTNSKNGGHISKDFRQGYGPECYVIRDPIPGKYKIEAHYYASIQASTTTGMTSCVIWAVKNLGSFDIEEIEFKMVRLQKNASTVHALDVHV